MASHEDLRISRLLDDYCSLGDRWERGGFHEVTEEQKAFLDALIYRLGNLMPNPLRGQIIVRKPKGVITMCADCNNIIDSGSKQPGLICDNCGNHLCAKCITTKFCNDCDICVECAQHSANYRRCTECKGSLHSSKKVNVHCPSCDKKPLTKAAR